MSDFLQYANRPPEQLYKEVADAQRAESVPTDQVELNLGAASARVRLHGGFITRLVLSSEAQGPTEVLYSDPDTAKPKLPASHIMMPVGPSSGPGGQHGPARWVWHDVAENSVDEQGPYLAMVPRLAREFPFVSREIALLDPSEIGLGISATNRSDSSYELSLGEHLYFNLPVGNAGDVRIDGDSFDSLIRPGASAAIDRGEAQFWREYPGFVGAVAVEMPHGTKMLLGTDLTAEGRVAVDTAGSLGMLVWRRPGQPFICLEPTLGYGENGSNDNLILWPGATAVLATKIWLS